MKFTALAVITTGILSFGAFAAPTASGSQLAARFAEPNPEAIAGEY
jgi:hypothetical protein